MFGSCRAAGFYRRRAAARSRAPARLHVEAPPAGLRPPVLKDLAKPDDVSAGLT
jgi:hypothetical protein